jgi:hypothetical protein
VFSQKFLLLLIGNLEKALSFPIVWLFSLFWLFFFYSLTLLLSRLSVFLTYFDFEIVRFVALCFIQSGWNVQKRYTARCIFSRILIIMSTIENLRLQGKSILSHGYSANIQISSNTFNPQFSDKTIKQANPKFCCLCLRSSWTWATYCIESLKKYIFSARNDPLCSLAPNGL